MSTLTLIIGNKNYSSWSLRPWIFMKQAGIQFTEIRIPLMQDNTTTLLAPYFSGNKVPILKDDAHIVWDSIAICEYLTEKFPSANGWPVDAQARSVARSVSAEMHSSFSALRHALPMNCRKNFDNFPLSSAVQTDIDRICAIWRHCREKYGQNGPWLFGDFCIADAMFAPVAIRFSGYRVPLGELENKYTQTQIQTPFMREWIEAGSKETEIITEAEVNL